MSKQNNANSTHLDICLGDDYVSIKTLNSDKSSFSDFILEKKLKTGSLSDFLDNIFSEKNIYELNVENVNVHFDNDLFCLVPNELFEESQKKEYLKYITKISNDEL
jgi:predicted CopG family antitoxin